MKLSSLSIAFAIAAFTVSPAIAEDDSRDMKDSPKGELRQKMAPWKDLGLTEQQREQLKPVFKEMRDARMANMEKVKAIRESIKAEFMQKRPSESVLGRYAQDLGVAHTELVESIFKALLKVKGSLSEEQFGKLLERETLGSPKGDRGDRQNGEDSEEEHDGKDGQKDGPKKSCPLNKANPAQ